MLTCPNCNKEVNAGAKFCSHCGTPIPEKGACPVCGLPVGGDMAFCPHCGTPIQFTIHFKGEPPKEDQ